MIQRIIAKIAKIGYRIINSMSENEIKIDHLNIYL